MSKDQVRPAESIHGWCSSDSGWLRIAGVAAVAFAAVELEKWIRFGRGHDTRAVQRQSPSA